MIQRTKIEIATVTRVVADRGFAFVRTRTGHDVFIHVKGRWQLTTDEDGLVVTAGRKSDWPVEVGEKLVLFGVERTDRGVGCKAWGSADEYSRWELYDTPQHRAVLRDGTTRDFPNLGTLVEEFPRAPAGVRDSVVQVLCRIDTISDERRYDIHQRHAWRSDEYLKKFWSKTSDVVLERLLRLEEREAQREIDALEWDVVPDPRPEPPTPDLDNPFVKALSAGTKGR